MLDKITQWIVITGCSTGIGHTTTKYLLDTGFNVIATARHPEKIEIYHDHLLQHQLDVTDERSIERFVDWIASKELSIGALINNAGILRMGLSLTMPMEQIRQTFETNVFGTLQMIRAVIPFLHQNSGRIINISSDSGLSTQPYTTIYSMSKYAIESMTEGMYYEFKQLDKWQVDICMIEPGNITSSIMDKAMDNMTSDSKIPILAEEQKKIHAKLKQSTKEFKNSRSAELIASRIAKILTKETINLRHFAGTVEETKYVIQSLFEKIQQINQSSQFGLSRKQLQEEFEFILNL